MANTKEVIGVIALIALGIGAGVGTWYFFIKPKSIPGLGAKKPNNGGSGSASTPQATDEEYMGAFTHIANTEIEPAIRKETKDKMTILLAPFGGKYESADQSTLVKYHELNDAMLKAINRTRSLANNPELIKKIVSMANATYPGNEKEGFKQLAIQFAKNTLVI